MYSQRKSSGHEVTQTEVRPIYVRKAVAKKNEDTQTEILSKMLVCSPQAAVNARAWRYRPLQSWVREAAIVYDVTR